MKEIDARGLACPAPVLQTRAALENEGAGAVKVVVDNPASQQNVQRFLESRGFETVLEQRGDDFWVTGQGQVSTQTPGPQSTPSPTPAEGQRKIMVMCATDRIGFGDDALGRKLMVNFIRTLKEMGPDLWRLVLVNNGVKLTIDGSPVLADLQAYESEGLRILVCGTCLEHFDLLARKQVGETTNMLDIVTAMQVAEKVISI